ncbi:MAG TPA: hypothetical protein DCE56_06630 [Cyanobacteria bacterium UBA8553]|nr:hypothetical protein [Cyanobacteria bacterium UBA8553]
MLRTAKEAYVLTRVSPPQDRWSILLMKKIGYKFELAEVIYDGIGKDAALEIFEELTSKGEK